MDHLRDPIFILSSARSGSTLLRYIVDTHPAICCPPELNLGSVCEGLYWAAYDTVARVANVSTDDERAGVASAEVRRVVSGLMETYKTAKGKQIWCEKTPKNLLYHEVLSTIFPDARFLCLYRNCLDVVHSCIEFCQHTPMTELDPYFQKYPDDQITAMIAYWTDRAIMLLDCERFNPGRCFRIKYEDLVAQPAEALEPMFKFLGVSWDPRLLDSVFTEPHDEGDGDPKISKARTINQNSVGAGSTISVHRVPHDLFKQTNFILEQLGYPAVETFSAEAIH